MHQWRYSKKITQRAKLGITEYGSIVHNFMHNDFSINSNQPVSPNLQSAIFEHSIAQQQFFNLLTRTSYRPFFPPYQSVAAWPVQLPQVCLQCGQHHHCCHQMGNVLTRQTLSLSLQLHIRYNQTQDTRALPKKLSRFCRVNPPTPIKNTP